MRLYQIFCLGLAVFLGSCSKPAAPDVGQPQAVVIGATFMSAHDRFVVPGELSFQYDQRRWYATADARRFGYVPLPVAMAFARQDGGVVRFSLLPAGPKVTPKSVTEQMTAAFRGTDTTWSTVCGATEHVRGMPIWKRCETVFRTPSLKEMGRIIVRHLTDQRQQILIVVGQWPWGQERVLAKQCQEMAASVRPAAPAH